MTQGKRIKIYTKTGDKGETGLFTGERVAKDHLLLECYGTVDELNAVLGLAHALDAGQQVNDVLLALQEELFTLGADLATPFDENNKQSKRVPRIQDEHIHNLEKIIDHFDGVLEPLQQFILPGGTSAASSLHLARTICRRAERHAAHAVREGWASQECLRYLNRLSDTLFTLARAANHYSQHPESTWKGRR